MRLKQIAVMSLLSGMLMGCSLTPKNADRPIIDVAFSTPLATDFRSEIAIARYSELLYRTNLTDEQKAQLFYDRGVLFDSLGLSTLARIDFNRTLTLKPDLPEVYNFLGIHHTLLQQYDKAYEMFDAVIELKPEHEYVFLNRGIALYYGERPQLALQDFNAFLEMAPSDPYRVIWRYLAEKEVDTKLAVENLKQAATLLDNSKWAYQLVALFSGQLTEAKFLAGLEENVETEQHYAERLCEAYFYLAKLHLAAGNKRSAEDYFKLSLSTNVHEFVEYKYARLELELLYAQS
ncbi:lipoprotein NlpI [Pseudoalteromonas tunicata]|uniref:lipoprotein NlpI n=1 Tax=Pseudoalteromonas tunicata TaxID=314281 RepID=UPI00273DED8E|nr:lipoprotein NlpI [Pseudoalteromonas tunicata]MDP5213805.1 lipoprotein NlpI [Pseudoalteromonas tunicata]